MANPDPKDQSQIGKDAQVAAIIATAVAKTAADTAAAVVKTAADAAANLAVTTNSNTSSNVATDIGWIKNDIRDIKASIKEVTGNFSSKEEVGFIDQRVKKIESILNWILAIFGLTFLGGLATFILKGGLVK